MKKLIILSICALYMCACSHQKEIKNPDYSIGSIEAYKPMGKMPAIAYSFKLKGKEYGNDYVTRYYGGKWIVPDSASFKEGDSFMVEYEKSDPFVSRMLFKYAVKDSSDYRMWIKFFKSNPPK